MASQMQNISGLDCLKKSDEHLLISQKPKAIFFSIYSVISNFRSIDEKILNLILQKHKFPTLSNGMAEKIDNEKSIIENFINIFGDSLSAQVYNEYLQRLISSIDQMSLVDGTINLLQYCKKNSIKTVILSNHERSFIIQIVQKFNLSTLFDLIDSKYNSNLQLSFEALNFQPSDKPFLFIGSTIEEMSSSFICGCVPVILVQEASVFDPDLQLLLDSNFDNKIRVIHDQTELIQILEQSTKLWNKEKEEEVTKIVFIGAGGNIGKQSIPKICEVIPDDVNSEIVLIGSGSDASLSRLTGFSQDITGSFTCCRMRGKRIKFTVTNDYCSISNANVVCCSAGNWPSPELSAKFAQIDPTGRTKQSFVNKEMIENIALQCEKYSPKCLLVLATNQVDMMCAIARLKAPRLNVLGLSGPVDSARLKQIIHNELNVEVSGYMIGFHNSSMFPLVSSVKIGEKLLFPFLAEKIKLKDEKVTKKFQLAEKNKMDLIVSKIRKLGPEIARMQKVGIVGLKNNGATVLPAQSFASVVGAFCFDKKIVESFNTFIVDQSVADHYGVPVNSALSIPLLIEKGKVTQIVDFPVMLFEKEQLKAAQNELNKEVQLLVDGKFTDLLKE